MKYWISLGLIFVISALSAQQNGTLSITSKPGKSWVKIDSVLVGQTPIQSLSLSPGYHSIQVFPPSASLWHLQEKTSRIYLNAGQDTLIQAIFTRPVLINSIPYGAEVFLSDTSLGSTPLYVTFEHYQGKSLRLEKAGFHTYYLNLTQNRAVLAHLEQKKNIAFPRQPSPRLLGVLPKKQLESKFALLALTVTAHWLSFYFKNVADSHLEQYRQNSNGHSREQHWQQTQKYDRISEVSLGISYSSLAALVYLILKY